MPIGIVLLLGTSVAGLVFACLLRCGARTQQLEQRLAQLFQSANKGSAEPASVLRDDLQGEGAASRWLLTRLPRMAPLQRILRQSGGHWTLARFCSYSLAGAGFGWALSDGYHWSWPQTMVVCFGLGAAPSLILSRQRRQRLAAFDSQLPDALDLMSRTLQIGMTLSAALSQVAEEFPEPLGPQFRHLNDELIYGSSFDLAFQHLSQRIPSEELRYFVTATLVQREVGGNLSELIANIAGLIRQRLQLRGKIQVLTAEGRVSAGLLTLLPFIMMALLSLVNHAYISVLWTDPSGKIILYVMLSMMLIGNVMMRRMVQIKY